MKKIATYLCLAFLLAIVGCASREDGGDDGTDAMNDVDADTNGDEVPGPETAAWPCRGGTAGGVEYFECNPNFIEAAAPGENRYWVGECPSEAVSGYWSGAKETPILNANGWYRTTIDGASADCELTISQCPDKTNPHCWMQVGTNTITDDSLAGPYRWCGGSDGSCAMRLKRNTGHTPTPLGN